MPVQTKTDPPPPAKTISFKYTTVGIVGIRLISPTVYSNTATTSMNGKPRLVKEKYAIPLLSKAVFVCTCPINMIYAMTSHNQHTDDVHLASRAIAHRFGRYTVALCTMGVSSSGSLEAVAQVGVLNIAVLATRLNAWTFSTWSIFRTPCWLKTLPKVSNCTSRRSNIHSNSIHRHTSIKHAKGTFA